MNEALLKMMLKNIFGVEINPEEVRANIQKHAKMAMDTIENIDKKLAAIQKQNELLIACYDEGYIKAARDRLERRHNGTSTPAIETAKIQH